MVRSIVPLFTCALLAAAPALATEVVPVPHFKGVELRGGGEVVVQRGPVQRVTLVEGSSRYTRVRVLRDEKLTIDICNSECPRNYRLKVIVESPNLPLLAVDAGGKVSTAGGFGGQQEVVAAVNGGMLTIEEACERYQLTLEEFASWQRAVERSGLPGLRVTRTQHYRDLYERHQRY